MRAKDIKVGSAYLVEMDTYPVQRLKATVLEVPIVRMAFDYATKTEKPYRRDGRADGARVRTEQPYHYAGRTVEPGAVKDLPLVKVIRPWDDADDRDVQITLTRDKRWAALASRAVEKGIHVQRSGNSALIGWDELEALLS
jgi:hypothetical protein